VIRLGKQDLIVPISTGELIVKIETEQIKAVLSGPDEKGADSDWNCKCLGICFRLLICICHFKIKKHFTVSEQGLTGSDKLGPLFKVAHG